MEFTEGAIYHIYNRGNNGQRIFFSERNYLFFFEKVKKYLHPHGDFLAWVLMPTHFHFLVRANQSTCRLVKHTPIPINALTEGIRLLLSSYAKAIQKQESIKGNLFQQKTKAKCVDHYCTTAFHYIHQNPFKDRLIEKLEDWRFSSLQEYLHTGKESQGICNQLMAFTYLDLDPKTILKDSYSVIREDHLTEIL